MNTLLIAVFTIIGVAFLLALARGKAGSRRYPYQLSKYLLSKAERSFYGVLVQAVGQTGLVFSKVRVADVITPKKGLNRSDWQRAFNAVSAKHFDFLICDPQDCSVRLAVELDDSSHGSASGRKRDNLINGACESAGLPLLRVKAAKGYVVADIQRLIQGALSPSAEIPTENDPVVSRESEKLVPMVAGVTPESVRTSSETSVQELIVEPVQDQKSRPCPKCGEAMLRRKANSGANAGKEFWGCSTFPKCPGVTRINA